MIRTRIDEIKRIYAETIEITKCGRLLFPAGTGTKKIIKWGWMKANRVDKVQECDTRDGEQNYKS